MKKYLEAGKIRNTHGVKGAMKAEHWCDSAAVFTSLPCIYTLSEGIYKEHKIVSVSVGGDGVLILRLDDVNTFEDAARLKNTVLYASREHLPEQSDRVYIADMIGLPVFDARSKERYGTLSDVTTTGAQELFVIETENGQRLVPAVKEFISDVVLGEGIYITPIPGLMD